MTGEILFVFAVVAVAGTLLGSGKVRLDIVALLVVLAFVLSGTLTPSEAFSGFGEPVVIMVAALLVISDMLARTGIAHQIGKWLVRVSRDGEIRLLILLTLVVVLLGSFMSNVAVIAIFIPVVMSITNRSNLNPSRLLMPLAYAGIVSGMTTLIATTSNLVASAELVNAGFEPFGFFSFTPIGLAVLTVMLVFMITAGRRLLPGERINPPKTATRTVSDLLEEFKLPGTVHRLKVTSPSKLIGGTLASSEIGKDYDVRVVMVERYGPLGSAIKTIPAPDLEIRPGDVLVVVGEPDTVEKVQEENQLEKLTIREIDRARWIQETGIAKVLIHPGSGLIGNNLRRIGLRTIYGIQVLGILRKNEILPDFVDRNIQSGDSMLIAAPWSRIQQLQSKLNDFVVLAIPAEIENVAPSWQRAPLALAILALMIALSVFKIVPIAISVVICALLAVVTRCLSMEQAYRAIRWSTVILIAGMMSISKAFEKTDAVDFVVEQLVNGVGAAGPYGMLAILFVLAALLSILLSGAPTTILLAPIAIQTAQAIEVSPYAFAITVAIGASSSYVLPVANPAATLVISQGKYRLSDFFKVGIPLLILTGLVTLILAPLLYPF